MAYEDRHVSERTKAHYEGKHARRRGAKLNGNPYTGSIGMNSLHWASGWRDEDEALKNLELCPSAITKPTRPALNANAADAADLSNKGSNDMKTKEGFARDGASVRFNGTPEQLMNALRELERRGGATGAICSAAANEIERLRGDLSLSESVSEARRGELEGIRNGTRIVVPAINPSK